MKDLFSPARLTTVALALVAVAIANRVEVTRKLING